MLGDSLGTLGRPSLINPGFSNPDPTVLHSTLCGLLATWLQGSLRMDDAAALAALLRQRPVAGLELWLEGGGAASAPLLLPQFVASVASVPTQKGVAACDEFQTRHDRPFTSAPPAE